MVMVIVNILVNTRKIQHPTSQRGNINQNLLTIIQERLGQIAQPVQTTLLHQVNSFIHDWTSAKYDFDFAQSISYILQVS